MNCFIWTKASDSRNTITARYEPLQPFLFLSLLEFSGADVVLDVGANVGIYSLVSTLAQGVESIYAFEAEECAHHELEKNVVLNGVGTKIKVIQAAVSGADGVLRFGTHAPMAGVNGVIETSIHDQGLLGEVKEVKAVRLDSLEDLQGRVLGIKIDVEGHELNVIQGAVEVLKQSPAFIQVEHYLGGKIDEALSALGYFRFFTAGHDHYFTNIRNFANPLYVKRMVEHAVSWLIESQSGRWPGKRTIKDSLSLIWRLKDGEIDVEATLDRSFFVGEVEYAFYLVVNGAKTETQWYQEAPTARFAMPVDAESIVVKGFVREIECPDKKVVTEAFIKQPATSYRARSAVEESLDLPSPYATLLSRVGVAGHRYPDIELSGLLADIAQRKPENLIQLGGDAGALEIVGALQRNRHGRLIVVCTPQQQSTLEQFRWRAGAGLVASNLQILRLHRSGELKTRLTRLGDELRGRCCVLLRAQFLADVGEGLEVLGSLFERLEADCTVYAEALANESYRVALTSLARAHALEIAWLRPRSTIIPAAALRDEVSDVGTGLAFERSGSDMHWLRGSDGTESAVPRVWRLPPNAAEELSHASAGALVSRAQTLERRVDANAGVARCYTFSLEPVLSAQ